MQVIIESYSGSIFTDILGIDYYNAYQNVGAIGLKLYEPGTEHLPAVLIGAHFDSSIGTPGTHPAAKSHVKHTAQDAHRLPTAQNLLVCKAGHDKPDVSSLGYQPEADLATGSALQIMHRLT